ncbi:Phenolphthiocerol synthesis polyketide synthase type I Pks15/1 [Mycobacterium marinum]|nr:Phenolphthiocerol synthesis polyketide synthase type I Pks15/1 [Mycobacterium marinum]
MNPECMDPEHNNLFEALKRVAVELNQTRAQLREHEERAGGDCGCGVSVSGWGGVGGGFVGCGGGGSGCDFGVSG